jgi:cytochrome c peroxidase
MSWIKKPLAMIAGLLVMTGAVARPYWAPEPVNDGDYYANGAPGAAKVELGRLLFFDKVLSGNRNISCATCHHPLAGTGDGLSLPVGEGGQGLGVTRNTGVGVDAVVERVPRNAPPIFNLGAREFTTMFADGRLAVDSSEPAGFASPAGGALPAGLDNVLAAQAMFPVTSGTEMAGQPGESLVADLAASGQLSGPGGLWDVLAARLRGIPEYVRLFRNAFPDVAQPADITLVHAANAIAAFEASAWRADDSAFDRFLRGDWWALSRQARTGARLFYGRAGCADCHAGVFQSDHRFYSIAMPQAGPGKGDGAGGREDFGRFRETGEPGDIYAFRVPSLRNVALTAPYGHSGAYSSLEAVVRHHLDPAASLRDWDASSLRLPAREDLDAIDSLAMSGMQLRERIAASSDLPARPLGPVAIDALIAFLHALTDPVSLDPGTAVPPRVPSGLPIYD